MNRWVFIITLLAGQALASEMPPNAAHYYRLIASAAQPPPATNDVRDGLVAHWDFDGTLVDTVYAHVFAWQRALAHCEMSIDGWRIHRVRESAYLLSPEDALAPVWEWLRTTQRMGTRARTGATSAVSI